MEKQFAQQVCPPHSPEGLFYGTAEFRLVPEEEHALPLFFRWSPGAEDRLKRVRIKTGVPCLCTDGERCGRKVLYLFQMEVEPTCFNSQLSHVLFSTTGMAADEVGDYLLAEIVLFVVAVEQPFELLELVKRRFPHESEYTVADMFGCNL